MTHKNSFLDAWWKFLKLCTDQLGLINVFRPKIMKGEDSREKPFAFFTHYQLMQNEGEKKLYLY